MLYFSAITCRYGRKILTVLVSINFFTISVHSADSAYAQSDPPTLQGHVFFDKAHKFINYFLTVQEKEVWGNLSLCKDDRIVPANFILALLDLQIKRDGKGIPLPFDEQPIDDMNIQGFFPVIINVAPIANVPLLLGLADQLQERQWTQPFNDVSGSSALMSFRSLDVMRVSQKF